VTDSGSNGGQRNRKAREFAQQIDRPERVVKALHDAANLTFAPPTEYTFAGETEALSREDAAAMAELFRRGALVQLARWWRDPKRREQVAEAVNALDENVLRFTLAAAIAELGDSGYDLECET
jgi:hypothetical protein